MSLLKHVTATKDVTYELGVHYMCTGTRFAVSALCIHYLHNYILDCRLLTCINRFYITGAHLQSSHGTSSRTILHAYNYVSKTLYI